MEGVFPNHCMLCGYRSFRQFPLCRACEDEFETNNCCCYRCAAPLPSPHRASATALCGQCLQAPPPFQRVIAPWLYGEQLAFLIQRWKFQGQRQLTPLLASLWLRGAGLISPVDIIIPVPLHWRRLWQRGFNQSELLSRQLCRNSPEIAAATLDCRSMRRCRATFAQSSMGARERAANLRGAFTANGRYDNLRVAIVDDVFTTGATAAALAVALRNAGARHIEVWCLARTPAPGA